MDGSDHLQPRSSKRRRVNNNGARSPSRYSSPDELAASSDHETRTYHRRTSSSNNPRRPSAEHQRRSYEVSDPSDSPDELDHTTHAFYRDNWNRNLRPTASRRANSDPPSDISIITPLNVPASPATPLPTPPKEARYLPYRQKMVLRGHSRGVSAVRFSPNGEMVASCCSSLPPLPRAYPHQC